jgi:hypothetical protein
MDAVTLYDPRTQQAVVVTVATEESRLRAAGYSDVPPTAVTVPDEEDAAFDPAEHTVEAVRQFMVDHRDLAETVLAAERAGRNRVSLTGGPDAEDSPSADPGGAAEGDTSAT